jgi:O2-independent ubiquinone biosynthesis accessory factor UbiT
MRGILPAIVTKIAGILPLMPMELAAKTLIGNALAARPGLVRRLAEYAGATFAIDPVDCPFVFLVKAEGEGAEVKMVRDADGAAYDARIKAPLIVLAGMIDGTYDGDALFFSRDLSIEGDTEAVLALRNALEDAEIDPASALRVPERFAGPFNRSAELAFGFLRSALHAPAASGPKAGGTFDA